MSSRRGAIAALFGVAVAAVAGRRLRRLTIAEHSMEPTLSAGDYVVARRVGTPQRGDIVTFRHPFRRDMLLVKRLVGLPGERVTVVEGRVHVDGVVLAEPWADGATSPVMELPTEPDHVVVLSDNRSVTLADSRTFGAIPVTALEHKVIARYWPPGSIGRI